MEVGFMLGLLVGCIDTVGVGCDDGMVEEVMVGRIVLVGL